MSANDDAGTLEITVPPSCLPCDETAEDVQSIPNKLEQYCFLCKYGGFEAVNLQDDCNIDVKAIENHLHHLRRVLGPARAARELKIAFDEHKRTSEVLANEPEWTEESIYDHLVVHAVPEALQRGENVDDFACKIYLLFALPSLFSPHVQTDNTRRGVCRAPQLPER